MEERFLNYIIQFMQSEPDAVARLFAASAALHLFMFLLILFLVARISHIENCLKDEWPGKFLGKM